MLYLINLFALASVACALIYWSNILLWSLVKEITIIFIINKSFFICDFHNFIALADLIFKLLQFISILDQEILIQFLWILTYWVHLILIEDGIYWLVILLVIAQTEVIVYYLFIICILYFLKINLHFKKLNYLAYIYVYCVCVLY